MFQAGTLIESRYEILGPLASGGMGTVYRARRVLLGDEVAIKVLNPAGMDPQQLRERFLRESRTCALLRHPNIVTILDFSFGPEHEPYLVMEHLNGPSLRTELDAGGPFGVERVLEIILPVCSALQFAHERRIVHQDLKPSNIVSHRFGSGEVVYKVIDFGVANIVAPSITRSRSDADRFSGTVFYASPEQFLDEAVDGRTDVYSLGAVIFELLTGRPPFSGSSPVALLTRHLTESPPAPHTLREGIPEWLSAVVIKALSKKRQDRWGSMAELARALQPAKASASAHRPASITSESGLRAKYVLGARLGSGRLGSVVYEGTHKALGTSVAIRVLHKDENSNWEAIRERFLTEARSLQAVHPSIIQVRDFGEDDECLYLVTNLIAGTSLRQLLDTQGPLEFRRLSLFVHQIADATAALHHRGGFLCGLTPDIIRMTTDDHGERLVISSGGIGQLQDLLSTISDHSLGSSATMRKELAYLPPEVLMEDPVEVRADIYVLGVLIYEMATGTLPFSGRTLPSLIGATLQGRPRDPREHRPTLPEAAASCILKCLRTDPSERFASARELLNAWPAA